MKYRRKASGGKRRGNTKCDILRPGSRTAYPIYDREKIEQIKIYFENNYTYKHYAYFKLGINIGLRADDLRTQKWVDYLDKSGSVREFFEFRETKTHKLRQIKLNESVRECLVLFRSLYPNDIYLFQSDSHVGRKNRKPWCKSYFQIFLKKAAENVNITERITPTSLRKTFAFHTIMTGKGLAIASLMELLGHTSMTITFRYVCLRPTDVYDLYDINL